MNSALHNTNNIVGDSECVLGIDIGGTAIKLGLFRGGQIIARSQIVTADVGSPGEAFAEAKLFVSQSLVSDSSSLDDLRAVGLAMAGVLDDEAASLKETANLQRWHGVDFRQEIETLFAKPVAVLNDANAAALGESVYGQHPTDSLALLTLGTGIGGGIVVDGRPLVGEHHCGGEVGHMAVEYGAEARPCGCGRLGHLESYAGAAGVVQTAYELLDQSTTKSLLQPLEAITPLDIAKAAERGDAVAQEVIDRTAVHLGRAIAAMGQVVDPSVLLLGGAMTFGGHGTMTGVRFLETIRREVARLTLRHVGDNLYIDFATLGNDGGIFGAAHFAIHNARMGSRILNGSRSWRQRH